MKRLIGNNAAHAWRDVHLKTRGAIRFIDTEASPKVVLKEWYDKRGQSLSATNFSLGETFHEGRQWWTAKFICPKSSDVFPAGTLDSETAKNTKWSQQVQFESVEIDGIVYYKKLKSAYQAAAARRLDVIRYNEGKTQQPRYCNEDPQTHIDVKENTVTTTEEDTDFGMQITEETQEKDIIPDINIARTTSPKGALHNYYDSLGIKIEEDSFQSNLHWEYPINGAKESWWTATFTCPKTGEVYETGSLLNEGMYGKVMYRNGKAYYLRKKVATQAVSARAIDTILYKATSSSQSRLCLENPAKSVASLITTAPDRQLTGVIHSKHVGVTFASEDITNERREEDDDNDEETFDGYYIQHEQPKATSDNTETLNRVVKAWSSSLTEPESTGATSKADKNKQIVAEARSWYDILRGQPTRPKDNTHGGTLFHSSVPMSSVHVGNAALKALANSTKIEKEGISVADKIFQFLKEKEMVDTETNNAFIQCLLKSKKGSDRQKAQAMYNKMIKESKTEKLDDPAIELFNTMLHHYSFLANPEKCEKVYNQLLEKGLKPNKETFRLLQRSMRRETFDEKKIRHWIEEGQKYCPDDDDLYYMSLELPSRKWWERFKRVYKNGFRNEATQQARTEAKWVESWISDLEKSDTKIKKEGYEAVVCAWTLCGTRKGLENANRWANKAAKASEASLSTYFPILLARAFSGDHPKKLQESIVDLNLRGQLKPCLLPNGRVQSLSICAWTLYAKKLSDEGDLGAAVSSLDEAKLLLLQLRDGVIEYHHKGQGHQTFIDWVPFVYITRCVRNLASANHEKFSKERAFEELIQMSTILGTTISSLLEQQNQIIRGDEGLHDGLQMRMLENQIQHLVLVFAHQYKDLVAFSRQLKNRNTANALVAKHLPGIEGLFLLSQQHERLLLQSGRKELPLEIAPPDFIASFHSPLQASNNNNQDVYYKTIKMLLGCNSDQVNPHKPRILHQSFLSLARDIKDPEAEEKVHQSAQLIMRDLHSLPMGSLLVDQFQQVYDDILEAKGIEMPPDADNTDSSETKTKLANQ